MASSDSAPLHRLLTVAQGWSPANTTDSLAEFLFPHVRDLSAADVTDVCNAAAHVTVCGEHYGLFFQDPDVLMERAEHASPSPTLGEACGDLDLMRRAHALEAVVALAREQQRAPTAEPQQATPRAFPTEHRGYLFEGMPHHA